MRLYTIKDLSSIEPLRLHNDEVEAKRAKMLKIRSRFVYRI